MEVVIAATMQLAPYCTDPFHCHQRENLTQTYFLLKGNTNQIFKILRKELVEHLCTFASSTAVRTLGAGLLRKAIAAMIFFSQMSVCIYVCLVIILLH